MTTGGTHEEVATALRQTRFNLRSTLQMTDGDIIAPCCTEIGGIELVLGRNRGTVRCEAVLYPADYCISQHQRWLGGRELGELLDGADNIDDLVEAAAADNF